MSTKEPHSSTSVNEDQASRPEEEAIYHEEFTSFPNSSIVEVILESSDKVRFRANGYVLTQWSRFFADMLSVPHSKAFLRAEDDVVAMSEPAEVIACMLRVMTGGGSIPQFQTVEELQDPLLASLKYRIKQLVQEFRKQLSAFASTTPVRAMKVAIHAGLHKEFELSRRAFLLLDIGLGQYDGQLDELPSAVSAPLERLHYRRMRQFSHLQTSWRKQVEDEEKHVGSRFYDHHYNRHLGAIKSWLSDDALIFKSLIPAEDLIGKLSSDATSRKDLLTGIDKHRRGESWDFNYLARNLLLDLDKLPLDCEVALEWSDPSWD